MITFLSNAKLMKVLLPSLEKSLNQILIDVVGSLKMLIYKFESKSWFGLKAFWFIQNLFNFK